jgi:hypothetical protein
MTAFANNVGQVSRLPYAMLKFGFQFGPEAVGDDDRGSLGEIDLSERISVPALQLPNQSSCANAMMRSCPSK